MKRGIILSILLIGCLTISAQEKKLPEGWDKILLEGKIAYMNLVTGDVSTIFPTHAAKEPTKEVEFDPTIIYKVKKGETLSIIARKHDMSLAELYRLNNLENFDTLEVGQEIVVGYQDENTPKKAKDNVLESGYSDSLKSAFHYVQSGETLFSISRKYNLSVLKLKRLNNLKSNNIFVDQKLKVQF